MTKYNEKKWASNAPVPCASLWNHKTKIMKCTLHSSHRWNSYSTINIPQGREKNEFMSNVIIRINYYVLVVKAYYIHML